LHEGLGYAIGWRAWKIVDSPVTCEPADMPARTHLNAYRLRSLRTNDRSMWPALQPSKASCFRWTEGHEAPDETCSCGIYAFKSLPALLVSLSPRRDYDAIGEIALWGKVIVAERGYRADHAYPLSITLLGIEQGNFMVMKHELGSYGVPVSIATYENVLRLANLCKDG
jgi:hypothetical protein